MKSWYDINVELFCNDYFFNRHLWFPQNDFVQNYLWQSNQLYPQIWSAELAISISKH